MPEYRIRLSTGLGDPRKQTPREVVEATRDRNLDAIEIARRFLDRTEIVRKVQHALNSVYPGGDIQVHIATTGSDGRLEKRGEITSPIQPMILVKRENARKPITRDVRDAANSVVQLSGLVLSEAGELKDLDFDDPTTCQRYEPPIIWPNLVLDLYPISSANPHLINVEQHRLAQYMRSPTGENVLRKTRRRLEEYRQITRQGKSKFKGQEISHFDKESGELYFDATSEVRQLSVKSGPLRAVQMFLAYQVLKLMRTNPEFDMHRERNVDGTRAKIADLVNNKVLDAVRAERIYELYSYFSWLFYISVHEYEETENKVTTAQVPDVKEFQKNLKELQELVKL